VNDTYSFWKNDDYTALMLACINGHLDIVKLLIQVPDCNLDKRTNKDETALMFAFINDHTEIVKTLIQAGCKINKKKPFKIIADTIFNYACENGDVELVQILIQAGYNKHKNDLTAFKLACENNQNMEIIKLLTKNGFNHDATIPLMYAFENRYMNIVEFLIKNKCGVKRNQKLKILNFVFEIWALKVL
jgi:ankyrin repeat protein